MNRFARILNDIDERVDKTSDRYVKFFFHYFPLMSASVIGILLLLFIHQIILERPYLYTAIIQSDLEKISRSLNQIDKKCTILDIKSDRTVLNFLNVEKFNGNEIGGIELQNPEHWHGPYALENPMIQSHCYELVRCRDGFYIVPGIGVRLPSGKIMGKDIVVNEQVNGAELLSKGQPLNYEGYLLARELMLGQEIKPTTAELAGSSQIALKEFTDAFPFAYNSTVPQEVMAMNEHRD